MNITRDTNSHEAYCYARDTQNKYLEIAISEAWYECENIDRYCEWDEHSLGHIVDCLHEAGKPEGDTLEHMLEPAIKPAAADEDKVAKLKEAYANLAVWLGYSNRNDQHEIEVRQATVAGFGMALKILGI